MTKINFDSVKGAIFDVDGTLLDSMPIWNNIGVRCLIDRGITPEPGFVEKFNKLSLKQAAEYYIEHYKVNETVEQISAGVNKMVEKFYFSEAPEKPGIKEVLELLSSKNIKMCVATATDSYLVEKALERNGILKYFTEIFTCTNVGAGKDEPKIYEDALNHLGCEKSNTLIFEDAYYAMKTAHRAGFRVVGIYDSSEKVPVEKVKTVCEVYLKNYSEII